MLFIDKKNLLKFCLYFLIFIQNPEHGLRISAQRGLACIFQALARKTSTIGLASCNDHSNLTLMHYAVWVIQHLKCLQSSIFRLFIIVQLLLVCWSLQALMSIVNHSLVLVNIFIRIRLANKILIWSGGTPLHYACRHGSLDAASCLLGNLAAINVDHQGIKSTK